MAAIREIGDLVAQREALLAEQFNLAWDFYEIKEQNDGSRLKHREVSLGMAANAIDLALPRIIENVEEHALDTIALVAPLRGALGLVTEEIVNHLRNRLDKLGYENINIELWAQGIKRYPEENKADVYFASGYEGKNNDKVHAVVFDWGTATGLTNVNGAAELKKAGVDFKRMTSLSMTLADKGKQNMLQNCVDEDGGAIHIEASTRGKLDDDDYIDEIAPAEGGEFKKLRTSKDWGAEMWGMEIDGDSRMDVIAQVEEFMEYFGQVFHWNVRLGGSVTDEELNELRRYYLQKYALLLDPTTQYGDLMITWRIGDDWRRYAIGDEQAALLQKPEASGILKVVPLDGGSSGVFLMNKLTYKNGFAFSVGEGVS